MNAYLLNVGLETLHLRMPQHCANALAVAKFVQKHPKIAWVNYPGLEGDKYHDLAQKYMPKGTCGVVTFGVKGGRKAAETFMAAEAGLHRHPCGGRQDLCAPPGLLHPPAAVRGGTGGRRRLR